MADFYREDLAHIHDVGFGGYALGSTPGILAILDHDRAQKALVVDLGCGSGLWAEKLTKAGYRVLGIDISEQMISIAQEGTRSRVQGGIAARRRYPPCHAVTAVGEVLNYMFDPKGDDEGLLTLFHRVYSALAPRGVFVFDLAEPGQVLPGTARRGFTEGEGWMVLLEKEEDTEQRTLTRRIVTFRRTTHCYRRDNEVHRQRLLESIEVAKQLRQAGIRVRTTRVRTIPSPKGPRGVRSAEARLRQGLGAVVARFPRITSENSLKANFVEHPFHAVG